MGNEYAYQQPTQRRRCVGVRLARPLGAQISKAAKWILKIKYGFSELEKFVKLFNQVKLNSITNCDFLEFSVFVTGGHFDFSLPCTRRPNYANGSSYHNKNWTLISCCQYEQSAGNALAYTEISHALWGV